MADKTLIDIEGLTRYHENINEVISNKADNDHNHDDVYTKVTDVEQMIAESIEIALNTEY